MTDLLQGWVVFWLRSSSDINQSLFSAGFSACVIYISIPSSWLAYCAQLLRKLLNQWLQIEFAGGSVWSKYAAGTFSTQWRENMVQQHHVQVF